MPGRSQLPKTRRRRSWIWRYRRVLFMFGLLGFTAVAGVLFVLSRVPLPDAVTPAQTTFLLRERRRRGWPR